MTEYGIDINQ